MSISITKLDSSMSGKIHNIESRIFPDAYSEQALKKDFSSERNMCFAAVSDGDIIGYYICSYVLDEAELERIAVCANQRGRGIASLMLCHLKEQCLSKGITNVYLEVRRSNIIAQNLYKKHDFIKTGERKSYYSDNGEDAILYTLSLNRR